MNDQVEVGFSRIRNPQGRGNAEVVAREFARRRRIFIFTFDNINLQVEGVYRCRGKLDGNGPLCVCHALGHAGTSRCKFDPCQRTLLVDDDNIVVVGFSRGNFPSVDALLTTECEMDGLIRGVCVIVGGERKRGFVLSLEYGKAVGHNGKVAYQGARLHDFDGVVLWNGVAEF